MTESAGQPAVEPVLLGRIDGLFGVQGWVKVYSYTVPREALLDYGPWWLKRDGVWQSLPLAEGRRHGKSVIARLEGYADRDQAAELLGSEIGVPATALPAPPAGQYYWRDLEGLDVVHRDGRALGRVAYVMETGAHDVLVVAGEQERLIPFVRDEVVLGVDLANRVIHVDWEWD